VERDGPYSEERKKIVKTQEKKIMGAQGKRLKSQQTTNLVCMEIRRGKQGEANEEESEKTTGPKRGRRRSFAGGKIRSIRKGEHHVGEGENAAAPRWN